MYQQFVSRLHRTAFLFLVDCSGSMTEPIHFRDRCCTKAEVVTLIVNELMNMLIFRSQREEGVRNYYDIGVWGYGGQDQVVDLFDSQSPFEEPHRQPSWWSVTEVAARPAVADTDYVEVELENGARQTRLYTTIRRMQVVAVGHTPMVHALRLARTKLAAWCKIEANRASFPPVVFNITDGEANDCSEQELLHVTEQIKALQTDDGQVLLINLHMGGMDKQEGLCFPSDRQRNFPTRYAELLCRCSSLLPAPFNEAIGKLKGREELPPYRGMSYNASATELLTLLRIGTVSHRVE